jgi:hypothetical protein
MKLAYPFTLSMLVIEVEGEEATCSYSYNSKNYSLNPLKMFLATTATRLLLITLNPIRTCIPSPGAIPASSPAPLPTIATERSVTTAQKHHTNHPISPPVKTLALMSCRRCQRSRPSVLEYCASRPTPRITIRDHQLQVYARLCIKTHLLTTYLGR